MVIRKGNQIWIITIIIIIEEMNWEWLINIEN